MFPHLRFCVLALVAGSVFSFAARGDDTIPPPVVGCAAAVDNYFENEVWAKVGVQKCLTCHRRSGDAEDSKFVTCLVADSAEVERTFRLFAGIVKDASEQKGLEKQETYDCRPASNKDAPGAAVADPHYTIRAWRGVVTYLLRRSEFLYE